MSESQVSVPLPVRLRFGHAALQHVADAIAVDVLHIKGAAVDPTLRPPELYGTDVDVIVRPDQFPRLDRELRRHGWRVYTTFASGSPFGHAQTLHARGVGVRRRAPVLPRHPPRARCRVRSAVARSPRGADRRPRMPRAERAGPVAPAHPQRRPCRRRQRPRPRGGAGPTRRHDRRREIEALAVDLDAPVAFAAATGGLERYRDERDYRLWKVITEGGTRSAEWRARIRAAPTFARQGRPDRPGTARERRPPRASPGASARRDATSSGSSSPDRPARSARRGARCDGRPRDEPAPPRTARGRRRGRGGRLRGHAARRSHRRARRRCRGDLGGGVRRRPLVDRRPRGRGDRALRSTRSAQRSTRSSTSWSSAGCSSRIPSDAAASGTCDT